MIVLWMVLGACVVVFAVAAVVNVLAAGGARDHWSEKVGHFAYIAFLAVAVLIFLTAVGEAVLS